MEAVGELEDAPPGRSGTEVRGDADFATDVDDVKATADCEVDVDGKLGSVLVCWLNIIIENRLSN